jgi:hypothetical protein
MTLTLIPWTGPTKLAKGRNPFNADAIGISHDPISASVTIHNRVASNGKTYIGWCAMPDDPELLRKLAAQLTDLADEIDSKAGS